MLGKTAGGLFWMFRSLERSENTARLLDAGFRIALTRSKSSEDEWASVLETAGVKDLYDEGHQTYDAKQIIDFVLRDPENPSSVFSVIAQARTNARLVRTALTREVWEATNECWMALNETLEKPIPERELPAVLGTVRQQSALVRGALHGTMLRNDIYDFARLGTFVERADNTARILDVKYYVLLPSVSFVGSNLDNAQWETILRSVSGQRAYRWLYPDKIDPANIAEFLITDLRMPRSLAFSSSKIVDNLNYLARDYGVEPKSYQMAKKLLGKLEPGSMANIFEHGLHEFLTDYIADNIAIGSQIEADYRFNG
jgi:uncharacterized alpha-E superfamily protein